MELNQLQLDLEKVEWGRLSAQSGHTRRTTDGRDERDRLETDIYTQNASRGRLAATINVNNQLSSVYYTIQTRDNERLAP